MEATLFNTLLERGYYGKDSKLLNILFMEKENLINFLFQNRIKILEHNRAENKFMYIIGNFADQKFKFDKFANLYDSNTYVVEHETIYTAYKNIEDAKLFVCSSNLFERIEDD